MKPAFKSFARDLSIAVAVTALLVSKWCGAADAPRVVEQKSCVVVVSFQTLANGSTVVRKQWVCEESK